MDEAAIREFFDGLVDAHGFMAPTTAIDGWATSPYPAGSFEPWLHDVFCRVIRHYVETGVQPLTDAAVISGADRSRLYEPGAQDPRLRVPGQHETRRWFLHRLSHEAAEVDEPWLYLVLPVGHSPVDLRGVLPPEVDTRGATGWFMWWFAELRGRGIALAMSGAAVLTDERGSMWSHDQSHTPAFFDRILRGHPARRRHPIRRT